MTNVCFILSKAAAREFGAELWRLRHEKHMYLKNVATQTGIPAKVIESMELGRSMRYGALTNLLEFYGKTAKIKLE